jgi:hypothetical protein
MLIVGDIRGRVCGRNKGIQPCLNTFTAQPTVCDLRQATKRDAVELR